MRAYTNSVRETATRGPRAGRFQGITWFRENETGDFLAVLGWTFNLADMRDNETIEGRVVAIANLPSSACSSSVSAGYLREKCTQVAIREVPQQWLDWLVPEDD